MFCMIKRQIDRLEKEIRDLNERRNHAISVTSEGAWDFAALCLTRVRELEALRDLLLERAQEESHDLRSSLAAFVTVKFKLFGSDEEPSMTVRADILMRVFVEEFEKLALPEHVRNTRYCLRRRRRLALIPTSNFIPFWRQPRLSPSWLTAVSALTYVCVLTCIDQKDYCYLTPDDLEKRGITESAVPLVMGKALASTSVSEVYLT